MIDVEYRTEDLPSTIVKIILSRMTKPHALPVRIEASSALSAIVNKMSELVVEVVGSNLPLLLDQVFELLDEVPFDAKS